MASPPPDSPTSLGPEEVRRLQAAHEAAMRALEAALRDTTRLTRLLTILSEGAPLEQLLDRVLSTLSELFLSDVAALLERRSGTAWAPRAGVGIPEDQMEWTLPGEPGTPIHRVIETRSAVQVADLHLDPGVAISLVQLGGRTALWLPVADVDVEAVLVLARCRVQPYAQTDIDLLGAMAYRIAVILERARTDVRLRDARDRLLQTERLALAGKVSGSMAHELNNPLAALRSNLEQLHTQVPALTAVFRAAEQARDALADVPGAKAAAALGALRRALDGGDVLLFDLEEILADSVDSVRRMGQLVGSLARLAASERFEPERLDLRTAVSECVADLPADTGRPALDLEASDGSPCIAWISMSALKVALTGILRVVLAPGLHRTEPTRHVLIRVEQGHGRPTVLVTDPALVLEEEERRAIFDPRMEEVETPRGRTVRLSLMATLSYQLLRGCGAEVFTETEGPVGLTVRVVLPAVPEVGG
jgi:C4-dicarboxylate-specific signal transduction histidine kinase